MLNKVVETDVLVLGGGIAGHRAALAAREKGKRVVMVRLGSGASPFVLAFNVPLGHVDERDSPEIYYEDMLRGGYYLNERQLVRALATDVEIAMRELEAIGAQFVRQGNGYAQRHLSGCTYPRSVYHQDGTGSKILQLLRARCREVGIETWTGWKVVSLLKDNGAVLGALAVKRNPNRLLTLRANSVVLAMGGIGRIYEDSTYPSDISANSYALALNAGARLIDMEFVQFEPTVVVHPEGCKGMEMPTAMLGDGAPLYNVQGERFMFRYNPHYGEKRIEKAKMSLYIQKEIDEGRGLSDGTVLFDTTALPKDVLESYKNHCKRLRQAGLEPSQEAPHVRPAAHSEMGGVYIDSDGWTGIPGLYACGESAGGVHGASRLAGNSGSDILVFGARAGRGAAADGISLFGRDWPKIEKAAMTSLESMVGQSGDVAPEEIKISLCKIMPKYAGLYRDADGLAKGLDELNRLEGDLKTRLQIQNFNEAVAAKEAGNMVLVAKAIIKSAQAREESRGAHQRIDFLEEAPELANKHVSLSCKEDGNLKIELIPVQ